jgi:hypothetical protein
MTDFRSNGAPVTTAPQISERLLGNEVAVFCEKCGYCLNGSPPIRCEHCSILHFRCTECNHVQTLNVLQPVLKTWLGRLGKGWQVFTVLCKIAIFAYLLIGWFVLGYELSYQRQWQYDLRGNPIYNSYQLKSLEYDIGFVIGAFCFGLLYGMFARMLLMRWKRSLYVGYWLAGLALIAGLIGAMSRKIDLAQSAANQAATAPKTISAIVLPGSFLSPAFILCATLVVMMTITGALIVWPIWSGLVKLFLPTGYAKALLHWQREDLPATVPQPKAVIV